MTNREFYEVIVNASEEVKAILGEEVIEFATNGIKAIDDRNASAKNKRAEKNATRDAERAPLIEALVAVVGTEPATMPALIAAADIDISTVLGHKFLAPFVEEGTIIKTEVKGEKGKVKAYKLA